MGTVFIGPPRILSQLFAHVQEITMQQNYTGLAYANLRLSRGALLTHLPNYLLNLSQHYEGYVDVMCNFSFAYFRACCNSPT